MIPAPLQSFSLLYVRLSHITRFAVRGLITYSSQQNFVLKDRDLPVSGSHFAN